MVDQGSMAVALRKPNYKISDDTNLLEWQHKRLFRFMLWLEGFNEEGVEPNYTDDIPLEISLEAMEYLSLYASDDWRAAYLLEIMANVWNGRRKVLKVVL